MSITLETLDFSPDGMKPGKEFVRVSTMVAALQSVIEALQNPAPPPAVEPPAPKLTEIVGVSFKSTSDKVVYDTPVTFGQIFKEGAVKPGVSLLLRASNDWLTTCQMDVKATYPDGSVKHAVLSAIVPEDGQYMIVGREGSNPLPNVEFIADLGATVKITANGAVHEASENIEEITNPWLLGPIVNEVHAAIPFTTTDGTPHPHLTARFAIRTYNTGVARVEVVVENAWAYEPNPQNFTYDVVVHVGGKVVFEKLGVTHLHHSRWRKVFWTDAEPALHVVHDSRYLIEAKAFPNYDSSITPSETELAKLAKEWNGPKTEIMGVGQATKAMPGTGGRDDIGILPGWAALYLLSMDERAGRVTMGTADLAGSWSTHYRDKNTDLPVSLLDYPYMTLLGNPGDTKNPVTKQYEAFPKLVTGFDKSPYQPDTSHQPNLVYLPYVLTGDHYYMEELQFWCMWNVFQSNPGYRKNILGLINRNQVRGQAWTLRTLAEAAYITPDSHPLKAAFEKILDNNLEYYNTAYTYNADANKLGVNLDGTSSVYKDETDEFGFRTAVAPWQDDFFTAAVGHTVDLGYTKALPLLEYKAKFPVGRMVDEGVCWLAAANYTYVVRTVENGPVYETFAEAYRDTVGDAVAAIPLTDEAAIAAALGQKPGDMGGYSATDRGFPSNMQPALAYAATYCGDAGKQAWAKFMSRSIQPKYGASPQFGIIPR